MGNAGWPDYMFLGRGGVIIFMEFKRLGGKLTPLQEVVRTEILARSFKYYVCDDVLHGKRIIDSYAEAAP